MHYVSTRDGKTGVSAAQAIVKGISEEGGLFVPAFFPHMGLEEISAMAKGSYQERACAILEKYLTDFTPEQIRSMVASAYGCGFDVPETVPVRMLDSKRAVAELWHGPTLAFKDMALQLLPHLMTASAAKVGKNGRLSFWRPRREIPVKRRWKALRMWTVHGVWCFIPKMGLLKLRSCKW